MGGQAQNVHKKFIIGKVSVLSGTCQSAKMIPALSAYLLPDFSAKKKAVRQIFRRAACALQPGRPGAWGCLWRMRSGQGLCACSRAGTLFHALSMRPGVGVVATGGRVLALSPGLGNALERRLAGRTGGEHVEFASHTQYRDLPAGQGGEISAWQAMQARRSPIVYGPLSAALCCGSLR